MKLAEKYFREKTKELLNGIEIGETTVGEIGVGEIWTSSKKHCI